MKGVVDYFIHNPLDTADTYASRHMKHLIKDEDKARREAWQVKQQVAVNAEQARGVFCALQIARQPVHIFGYT